MIALGEAQRAVLSMVPRLGAIEVPLAGSLDHVAAAPIAASEQVPGFANSAMDGFALRSSDTTGGSARLRVIGTVMAGARHAAALGPGEAMRIMTGAPMPEGADCVEIVEVAVLDADESAVSITRRVEPGTCVRRPGDDVEVGAQLVAAGDVLTPARVAVLAGQGVESVSVYRRPLVGVLSTGDELSAREGPLAPGAIRDVNRPLLIGLLGEAGVPCADFGVVADDHAATLAAVSAAVDRCDMVVSTGGVSMGEADFVKAVITELAGGDARSMQVAVRPGKPFSFGVVGPRRVPVFGLPGNPVSTRVSFELFVRPALDAMCGSVVAPRMVVDATLDCAMPRTPDGKAHMVHVTARQGRDGRLHVIDATRQGSHLLAAITNANAIAEVPDGEGLEPGAVVRVLVLRPAELGVTTRLGSA